MKCDLILKNVNQQTNNTAVGMIGNQNPIALLSYKNIQNVQV